MSEAVIRRARPDDADFLAWCVLAATRSHLPRGFFDLFEPVRDDARLDLLRTMLLSEKPSWWHWSIFWVAEHDGRPGAALAGLDPTTVVAPSISLPAAATACGYDARALAAAFKRCEPMFDCFHDPAPGAWIVESVATHSEARGRGLAAKLLARVLEEGGAAGHEFAQLSVFLGNTTAQRVYERAGFSVTAEKRSAGFEAALGTPGVAQMTARLR